MSCPFYDLNSGYYISCTGGEDGKVKCPLNRFCENQSPSHHIENSILDLVHDVVTVINEAERLSRR